MNPCFKNRCRGQITVMTALLLVVLIGSIGLAIDSGMGYLLRAKLSAAVDAAGIAAARAVTQGATQAEQIANAKRAARTFFDANFPTGYLGSTPLWQDPSVTFDPKGSITISTSAQATMPVSLMRVLGFQNLAVGSQAETVRRDLDMVFVVDTTGSMSSVAEQVKANAKTFLSMFNTSVDRVSLVHFAVGAEVDVPFKADQSRGFDRDSMNKKIDKYDFSANTNYSEGLWQARDQLNNVIKTANRSSLRVIVFFSDGAPNSFAANFTFKNSATCSEPGTISTNDRPDNTPPFRDTHGLSRYDKQNSPASGGCNQNYNIIGALASSGIPANYDVHPGNDIFPLIPNPAGMRPVNRAPNWANLNRIARNLAEEMADKTRSEGTYIFTLGLGPEVANGSGPDNETGETLLKNMAHTPDSSKFGRYPNDPVGTYCWAATTDDLKPCFSQLASEILRLTR